MQKRLYERRENDARVAEIARQIKKSADAVRKEVAEAKSIAILNTRKIQAQEVYDIYKKDIQRGIDDEQQQLVETWVKLKASAIKSAYLIFAFPHSKTSHTAVVTSKLNMILALRIAFELKPEDLSIFEEDLDYDEDVK